MKKVISLLLVFVICASLCACGRESEVLAENPVEQPMDTQKELRAEEEILGKWFYNTGFITLYYVFNEDMTCSYWSGAREPKNTTYKMEEGNLIVYGEDLDFYYAFADGKLEFWTDTTYEDGSQFCGVFTKDTTYNPDELTLALTEKMVNEIEEKIASSTFPYLVLLYPELMYPDLEFTDVEFTHQGKLDPYTYELNGIVYAQDKYGKKYRQNFDITFIATESSEEANGYSIDWDFKFVD